MVETWIPEVSETELASSGCSVLKLPNVAVPATDIYLHVPHHRARTGTIGWMSLLLLICLLEMTLQQVREHSDIHHKLDGPYGGNAEVHVQEAPDGRPDCA